MVMAEVATVSIFSVTYASIATRILIQNKSLATESYVEA